MTPMLTYWCWWLHLGGIAGRMPIAAHTHHHLRAGDHPQPGEHHYTPVMEGSSAPCPATAIEGHANITCMTLCFHQSSDRIAHHMCIGQHLHWRFGSLDPGPRSISLLYRSCIWCRPVSPCVSPCQNFQFLQHSTRIQTMLNSWRASFLTLLLK